MRSFAWAIDPWNAKTVEAELRKRGMTPVAENRGTFQSFHVKDPDEWDLQICNGEGLVKARKTPSTAKLSEPAPFAPTGWRTVWLDHLSFGVTNYKESVSFYSNLLGWQGSYDDDTQRVQPANQLNDTRQTTGLGERRQAEGLLKRIEQSEHRATDDTNSAIRSSAWLSPRDD